MTNRELILALEEEALNLSLLMSGMGIREQEEFLNAESEMHDLLVRIYQLKG